MSAFKNLGALIKIQQWCYRMAVTVIMTHDEHRRKEKKVIIIRLVIIIIETAYPDLTWPDLT